MTPIGDLMADKLRFPSWLLDSIEQAVIATDMDGRVTFWNRQAERLYGWTSGETLARNIFELAPSLFSGGEREAMFAELRRGASWSAEIPIRHRDGRPFPVAVTNSPILDDAGTLIGIVSVSRDVSDKVRKREALEQREAMLAEAQQIARVGSWELDVQTGITSWSDQMYRILGLQRGVDVPDFATVEPHIHPDDVESVRDAVSRLPTSLEPMDLEYRLLLPGGGEKVLYARGEVFRDAQGRPVKLAGITQDVTERKRVAAEIERWARQQEGIANLGQLALMGAPLDQLFGQASLLTATLLGNEFAAVVERSGDLLKVRAVHGWDPSFISTTINGRGTTQSEFAMRTGGPVAVEDFETQTRFAASQMVKDSGARSALTVVIAGRATAPFGVVSTHSISQRSFSPDDVNFMQSIANVLAQAVVRKGNETELIVTAAQQTAVAELGRLALSGIDQPTLEQACNLVSGSLDAEFATVLELHPVAEYLTVRAGTSCGEPGEKIPVTSRWHCGHTIAAGQPVVVDDYLNDTRFARDDYLTQHGIRSGMTVLIKGQGRPFGVLAAQTRRQRAFSESDVHFLQSLANVLAEALQRDAAERALAESQSQLEQANRLTSLGRLAANVAHEFNNVLMGIAPFVEVLGRQPEQSDLLRKAVAQISKSILRGKGVTEEILRYTQPAALMLESTPLGPWTEELSLEARSLLGGVNDFALQLADPAVFILIDPRQMHQVFINLILNARDAMPGGGTITLEARREAPDAIFPFAALPHPDRYVHFLFEDTGSGMSADTLRHIFEPLFTTKKSGTGLGLAVTHQVVKRHGGELFVESRAGIGTTFHLFIPVADEPPRTAEVQPGPTRSRRFSRVLLVEDDPAVASGLSMILEMEGVDIHLVDRGSEVRRAIEEFSPDVMLLDIGLPDMDGMQVYAGLEEDYPHLPVVFSTGHGDESKLDHWLARPHVGFLLKPYDVEKLLDALESVTRAGPSPEP